MSLELLEIDAPKSFIAGAKIDPSVCDGMIEFFNTCEYLDKEPGQSGGGVDKSVKDSTDMTVPVHLRDSRVEAYIEQLAHVTMAYIERYPGFGKMAWDLVAPFNIQKYEPGGGYFALHTEKMSAAPQATNRVMAWMTYLNDVEEGGHTYFPTQQAKIKPVKGLTLLWPADWTHLHQGIVAPNETKMIVTGWYDYVGTTDTRTLLQQETSAE